MSWVKNDIAFKTLIGKRSTDSNKNFYEEFGDTTQNVHFDDVWVSNIPIDPNVEIPSHIDFYDKHTLIEDPTVENSLTWAAVSNPNLSFSFAYPDSSTNPRLKDWISDKFGLNYEIKVFSNGTEIQKTNQTYPWFFNYQTGELLFNNQAPPEPIQITGYKYNGMKGIVADVDASGTTSQTFQLYNTNDGVKIKDASGDLEVRNYTDTDYAGIRSSFVNINTDEEFARVNIHSPVIEDLKDFYYVEDSSIFQGVYTHSSQYDPSIVNGRKLYANDTQDKCIYFSNGQWIIKEVDVSVLSSTEPFNWNDSFFFNHNIYGIYHGNTNFYGQELKIYNYDSVYKTALNVEGDVDITGTLGVHGKIIARDLQLDASFNGVVIAENGNLKISKYHKTKLYKTIITGNGTNTDFIIDHSIGTINHSINVYDNIRKEEVIPGHYKDINYDILQFSAPPSPTESYIVTIMGF